MEPKLLESARLLRTMPSAAAADWLMDNHPAESESYGDAISIIQHISLKKRDLIKLARHYFRRLPFSNSHPYDVFAGVMNISDLIDSLKENAPSTDSDKSLFLYYARPTLNRAAKTDAERHAVEKFIAEL